MEVAEYIRLIINVLYLKYNHAKSVSILEKQMGTGSNDYTIIGNPSKTRSIRTTHHYQVFCGI